MAPNTAPQAYLDTETGEWVCKDGSRVVFLPEAPAASPVHELINPGEPDESTADGHTHYAIGSEPEVVAAIVEFYEGKGAKVPASYSRHAKAHAAAVAKAAKAAESEPDE